MKFVEIDTWDQFITEGAVSIPIIADVSGAVEQPYPFTKSDGAVEQGYQLSVASGHLFYTRTSTLKKFVKD
jgi:hypothetical protein